MLRVVLGVLILIFFSGGAAQAGKKSGAEIFSENRPAVVYVRVAADPSSSNKEPSYGTGFIIGRDGYVLTAKHVLGGYINSKVTPISVRIGSLDGKRVAADYVPYDIGLDVAMLKLRNPADVDLAGYQTVERGTQPNWPLATLFSL